MKIILSIVISKKYGKTRRKLNGVMPYNINYTSIGLLIMTNKTMEDNSDKNTLLQ